MSYRPKIKQDASGTLVDLAIDAETLSGASKATSVTNVDTTIPTSKAVKTFVEGKGYTTNTGTVTSVRVQAGTGLSSSTSTAQSTTLDTTISVASGYKLPTSTEWNDMVAVAQGKTNSFITNTTQMSSLNTQNDSVEITSFKDKDGNTISLGSFKVGDIIYLTNTDVPDRWVGVITTSGSTVTKLTLYKMETSKVDLTAYLTAVTYDQTNYKITYTKNNTSTDILTVDTTATQNSKNLITSGAVYSGLSGKQATLVDSGTGQNIKTVNNTSIMGSGNIAVQAVIDSNNKLSSDLIDTTNHTNKFANSDGFATEDWTFTVENNGTTSTVTKRIYMKTITS